MPAADCIEKCAKLRVVRARQSETALGDGDISERSPAGLKLGPQDPWHYPRPKLAKKYLKVFDIGLIAAHRLFAKRRMGKSEFLEKDLLPAARKHGYFTAYLNLWDARKHPAHSLIGALALAVEPKGRGKTGQDAKKRP